MEKATRGNQEELEPCESGAQSWSYDRTITLWWSDIHSVIIPSSCSIKVVDARGGPSLKITSRPKKIKSISKKARPSQISRLKKELKRNSEFCVLTPSHRHLFQKTRFMSHHPESYAFSVCFVLPTRFGRPQHHLQCLSGSVSQLQQPVRWRLRHRAQPGIQPLPCFLISGPNILEEVSPTALTSLWSSDSLFRIKYYCTHWCLFLTFGMYEPTVIHQKLHSKSTFSQPWNVWARPQFLKANSWQIVNFTSCCWNICVNIYLYGLLQLLSVCPI